MSDTPPPRPPIDEPDERTPIDTAEPPHEPVVKPPSTVGMWSIVLAGPALWAAHFIVVYLTAETTCAAESSEEMSFIGVGATEVLIVVATVVGVVAALVMGYVSYRRSIRRDAPGMYRVGVLLSALSALAIVVVGVPVLVLPVCA